MRSGMSSQRCAVARNAPCSSEASRAELTPLPETSATTTAQTSSSNAHHVVIVAAHLVRRHAACRRRGTSPPRAARRGSRLCWMPRATLSSSSILCLARSSSSSRAFSSTVEASMARLWSSSRLPPARSAAAGARIHVEHADGFARRWRRRWWLPAPVAKCAPAARRRSCAAPGPRCSARAPRPTPAAGRSSWRTGRGAARARGGSPGAGRAGRSRPGARPERLRATRISSSPSAPQQQETALGAGDGERRVHHGVQHVVEREAAFRSVRATSSMARSLRQVRPAPGRPCRVRRWSCPRRRTAP